MSLALYIAAALVFIGGLIYAAVLLEVPMQWIGVEAGVMLGAASLTGVCMLWQKNQP
ncbi:MAG TPA: hypothetical protein VFY62_12215 [Pseudomonas sp.]|nr:hypothetical protein [Pseudomonas sp.]